MGDLSKMSKIADLDTIYTHLHVLCIWLVDTLKGGQQASKGGEYPPPPLNETLVLTITRPLTSG